jgi:predicted glycosyltransferase
MKVWIDLSNSPHPLLFAPVVRRLRNEGHEVALTARDNAQTVPLALERWPETTVIGGHAPRERSAKLRAIVQRVADLRRWATRVRPDVALSHNSYAQIVAARSLRVPVVTAMDFEHQPANHLAFRLAGTILLPHVLPLRALRGQGATSAKVVFYPGLKEEVYLGDFQPDPAILQRLGLTGSGAESHGRRTIVVARTPPSRALYHGFGNPLFERALQTLDAREDTVCVALTRHPEQVAAIQSLRLRRCIVPPAAIDSRSLMYAADAMIGAGGTMTREAALMGIPTWTLFAGATPAVDQWLERQGRLARLTQPEQLAEVTRRSRAPRTPSELRDRGRAIEDVFMSATLEAAERGYATMRPRGA